MKLIVSFLFLFVNLSFGQKITCSPKDKKAFENKIIEIDGLLENDFGKTLVAIGKTFLGTPYVAKTLEIGNLESLVINLQGLDCTTYIENVLAFSLLLKDGKSDFKTFTEKLETIRYKNGKLNGYTSRLHYFSAWIIDNETKGLLTNITSEIGGSIVIKKIDFMSTHPEFYPFLKDNNANIKKIQTSENYLNSQEICILAQDEIEASEHLIKSGDIIALTTSIKGLDITHTGIATREKDGRIHLLHASTVGEVVVSRLPLIDYLKKIKNNTGIIVARPTNL